MEKNKIIFKFRIVILVLFLLSSQFIFAQEICIDKFNGFPYSIKRSFIIDEIGRLLIATDGKGLVAYDGYDLTFYDPQKNAGAKVYNYVRDLEQLPDGTIISALEGRGTIIYGKDSSRVFTEQNGKASNLYNDRIESYWSRNDTLIVGDKGANLSFIDLNNFKVFKTINLIHRHPDIIHDDKPRGNVFDLETDKVNSCIVWILAEGLIKYNLCTDKSIHYPQGSDFVEDRKNDPLKIFSSYGMYELEQYGSKMFIASWGGGILYFDKITLEWKKELFEPYTDRFILDENIINYLIPINDTILLANGDATGFFFDMKNLKKVPTLEFLKDSFNITQRWTADGMVYKNKLYTGDRDKFCVYPINEKYKIKEVESSHIYIKSLSADGKDLNLGKSIYPNFETSIPKEFRNIRLDFRLPLPSNPNHVEYAYKLKGKKNEWVEIGTEHTVQFSNLAGGQYELHIRAQEKGMKPGAYYYLTQPLSFSIEKLIIEKLWFRALVLFGISFILYTLLKYYLKTQRDKQELRITHLKELQEVQLSALRARMNPHFLFNSLTSINNFVMHEDPRQASRYLTKFSHLMRKVLNNSHENLIPLEEELSTLKLYIEMEQIRFENKFEYFLEMDPQLNASQIFIPTMLLQPYIENSIHHGLNRKLGNGNLILKIIKQASDQIEIQIEDDGIGRASALKIKANKTVKNKSMGMNITENRLQLIQEVFGLESKVQVEDLVDPDGLASGTRVTLILPHITNKNKDIYEHSQAKN